MDIRATERPPTMGAASARCCALLLTAAVATADLKGRMDEPFLLDENSQGALGYEDLSLSWSLAFPPAFTVFVSKNKNFRLATGTQMLLRIAAPRLAK